MPRVRPAALLLLLIAPRTTSIELELHTTNFEQAIFSAASGTRPAWVRYRSGFVQKAFQIYSQKVDAAWDELEEAFDDSPAVLLGTVDCDTREGDPLCDSQLSHTAARSLPALLYYAPPNRTGEVYHGGYSYKQMKSFADELVKGYTSAELKQYMDMPLQSLESAMLEKKEALTNKRLEVETVMGMMAAIGDGDERAPSLPPSERAKKIHELQPQLESARLALTRLSESNEHGKAFRRMKAALTERKRGGGEEAKAAPPANTPPSPNGKGWEATPTPTPPTPTLLPRAEDDTAKGPTAARAAKAASTAKAKDAAVPDAAVEDGQHDGQQAADGDDAARRQEGAAGEAARDGSKTSEQLRSLGGASLQCSACEILSQKLHDGLGHDSDTLRAFRTMAEGMRVQKLRSTFLKGPHACAKLGAMQIAKAGEEGKQRFHDWNTLQKGGGGDLGTVSLGHGATLQALCQTVVDERLEELVQRLAAHQKKGRRLLDLKMREAVCVHLLGVCKAAPSDDDEDEDEDKDEL